MAEAMKAKKDSTVRLGESLITKISEIENRARVILDSAEAAGSLTGQLGALRELRETIRLLGQVTKELHTGPMTINNFILTPEWILLKTTIANTLKKYPDALRDVVVALKSLNADTEAPATAGTLATVSSTAADAMPGLPAPISS